MMIEWLVLAVVAGILLWLCLFVLWCILAFVLLGMEDIDQMQIDIGTLLMPTMVHLVNTMEEFIGRQPVKKQTKEP